MNKTEPEREPDTLGNTPEAGPSDKSLKTWCPGTESNRRHADFQSSQCDNKNKALAPQKYQDNSGTGGEPDTPAKPANEFFSRFMPERFKRAAKALGHALVLASPRGWLEAGILLNIYLEISERMAATRALLGTLPPDKAVEVAADRLRAAGQPLPAFLGGMHDATQWAEWATDAELRAYCLASYLKMKGRDQDDFREIIEGKAA